VTVLITGDRNWTCWKTIKKALANFPKDTVFCHGNARGADKMCAYILQKMGFPEESIRSYPADWDRYKKAAGPIRNRKMFDSEQPDLVLAFHNDLASSKGTADMVAYAESKDCKVERITEGDDQQRGTDSGASAVANGLPEVGPTA
jgi:hypothetical protein